MLDTFEPRELVVIASSSSLAGLAQATTNYAQVPVSRQLFDDTQVKDASAGAAVDR